MKKEAWKTGESPDIELRCRVWVVLGLLICIVSNFGMPILLQANGQREMMPCKYEMYYLSTTLWLCFIPLIPTLPLLVMKVHRRRVKSYSLSSSGECPTTITARETMSYELAPEKCKNVCNKKKCPPHLPVTVAVATTSTYVKRKCLIPAEYPVTGNGLHFGNHTSAESTAKPGHLEATIGPILIHSPSHCHTLKLYNINMHRRPDIEQGKQKCMPRKCSCYWHENFMSCLLKSRTCVLNLQQHCVPQHNMFYQQIRVNCT